MPKKSDVRSEALEDVGLAIESIERLSWGSTGDIQVTGLSVRLAGDCLLTVRAVVAREKQVVAFVGATTMGNALLKAAQMLRAGAIEWKEDKWARKVAQNGSAG